jgi:hypothetical protein
MRPVLALAVQSKEQLQLGAPMPPQINPNPPDPVDHGRRPKLLQRPAMEGLLHGALDIVLTLAM